MYKDTDTEDGIAELCNKMVEEGLAKDETEALEMLIKERGDEDHLLAELGDQPKH